MKTTQPIRTATKRFLTPGLCSLLLSLLLTGALQAQSSKPVIFAQLNNSARTQNIVQNINYIESLPFEGMAVNIPQSWFLMNGQAIDYPSMYNEWLAPLNGIYKKFTHNYLATFVDKPADVFDDWTVTIDNFRKMARGAKAVGFKGVIIDNEEYARHLWNYPDDVNYKSKTLAEYQAQVRLRGKQIMEAMVAEFPAIKVLVLHGPYLSEPKTPSGILLSQAGDASYYELLGPFFVGLVEGKGSSAEVTDGGEVYQYRSKQDFQNSYQWRKYDIASSTTNSTVIPTALRSGWPTNVSCSFGVYNQPWIAQYPMNATIMATTLTHALQRSDNAVWFYVDGVDWLLPGGMPQEWINAVNTAKTNAGPYVVPPPTAGNLLTNPGFESGLASWSDWGTSALSAQLRSGANALQVGTGAGGRGQTLMGLKTNTAYQLTAWGKLGASNAGNAYIGIQFKNSSGGVITNYNATITSTTYSQKTVSCTSPTSFAYAEVYVWKDAGSALVHVDDFALREAGQTGQTVTVRARGTCGTETIELRVNDLAVRTWTNLSTAMTNYTHTGYTSGNIKVVFTNDVGGTCGKDVQVDYIQVGTTTYQAENQATNTGVWNSAQNKCGGVRSEWLQCNGYIDFGSPLARLMAKPALEEAIAEAIVRLAPNPASERVQVTLVAKQAQRVVFNLLNLQGQRVQQYPMQLQEGENKPTLPLKGFHKGLYLLNVTVDGQRHVKKLVIQ